MIVVSEIGDKTFLIAAIMAMKHSRLLVFSAALSALAIMSVLSAAFGHAVPNLIPRTYTNYLAALLFFCFGIRMFYDGYYMTEEDAKHELEEVTQELQDKEDLEMLQRAEAGDSTTTANQAEDARDTSVLVGMDPTPSAAKDVSTKKPASGVVNLFQLLFSPIFVQTFVMTFLAEWGDRSQIATIALAAAHVRRKWILCFVVNGGNRQSSMFLTRFCPTLLFFLFFCNLSYIRTWCGYRSELSLDIHFVQELLSLEDACSLPGFPCEQVMKGSRGLSRD